MITNRSKRPVASAIALAGAFLLLTLRGTYAEATQPSADQSQPQTNSEQTQPAGPREFSFTTEVWRDDFDKMMERRVVRFVVPYSRTLYFSDKGRERGISADLVREFERYINKKYAKQLDNRPITVLISAVTRDQLLPDVHNGIADVAVGNLTVTKDRLTLVDMVAPGAQNSVKEIVLTGPKSPELKTIEDLSGKTLHVRRSSSYYDSLVTLNQHFAKENKPPMNLVFVPDALEDEDMMEMLNAGLLDTIVVDDWKAKMWAPVYTKLALHEDILVRQDGRIGWAVRKDSPLLTAELNDFYKTWVQKQSIAAVLLQRYMKSVKQMTDPTRSAEMKRFEATVELFQKYGKQYDFNPLMLAAQGYQESGLNHKARSKVGAIGIMQIMPATGKEMKVGDIRVIDANIHASAKYLDKLMAQLGDTNFKGSNRTLFSFAAYNCGPGNLAKARKTAAQRGLDPNVWFNNVEIVVAEQIGIETTTYVRNIFKYYVAYKLTTEAQQQAAQARSAIDPAE